MQPTSQKSPPQISPEQTCGQEDSRVRIFRSLAASEGLTEQEVDSFLHLLNSSKAKVLKIDPHGLSLKMLRISYPFIIYDCGVMQTPTSIFRDADHRLLCGSVLPYEIPVFHKALSECGSLEVRPVAICVPQEIQEYCMELFGENVQIAAASHDLFAKRVNGQIYRPLVEKYIAGEKRL